MVCCTGGIYSTCTNNLLAVKNTKTLRRPTLKSGSIYKEETLEANGAYGPKQMFIELQVDFGYG